ncbi:MAG: 2OG-Fe(II) oxygenase [Burkholderiales bacterium]
MSQATAFVYLFPDRIESATGAGATLKWPEGVTPFHATRDLVTNPYVRSLYIVADAFTPDECGQIVALGAAHRETAAVYNADRSERDSVISWLEPRPETHWLYHRLAVLFRDANRQYDYSLVGFAEALQLTEYGVGGHFDWHLDIGPEDAASRKLSLTVLMNAPSEYDGGQLEFFRMGSVPPDLTIGTALFFPSYLPHRVAPVTRGIRRSLVAWAYGNSFR